MSMAHHPCVSGVSAVAVEPLPQKGVPLGPLLCREDEVHRVQFREAVGEGDIGHFGDIIHIV